MGNFAQMSLPLADSATLTLVRINETLPETITVSRAHLYAPLSCHYSAYDSLLAALPFSDWNHRRALDRLGLVPSK
jgi:hypothetical protein